jgi:hemoglobin
MSEARHDITDRDDLATLITTFYGRAFQDELLGHVFVDVAKLDLDAHLPTMVDFWEQMLLGGSSYSGGAFFPHAQLNQQVRLTRRHFDRWLAIWTATVTHLFEGPVADAAVFRATRVADAFSSRLNGEEPLIPPSYVVRGPNP